jgi:septal ring factor EnvC (AmiA/AmiB activator)
MSAMIEQMQARLAALRQEYMTGQSQLRELAQQEAALRETLLRISGAIQVLEELISSDSQPADPKPPRTTSDDEVARDEQPHRPDVLTVP